MSFLRNRFSVAVIAVLILLIFLHYAGMLAPAENFTVKLLAPAQSAMHSVGNFTGRIFTPKRPESDLEQEVESLQKRVNTLLVENQKLHRALTESQSVVAQLDFLQESQYNYVLARVVGEDFGDDLNAIVIDKGTENGIKVDMPVIVDEGIIIGKVTEVQQSYSKILLATDQRSQIAAAIENSEQTQGVVSGDFGFVMKMELIPSETEVNRQDVVITSGLEQNIPRGLIIGEVNRVEEEPNSFFKTAYLQTLQRSEGLSIVSVIVR